MRISSCFRCGISSIWVQATSKVIFRIFVSVRLMGGIKQLFPQEFSIFMDTYVANAGQKFMDIDGSSFSDLTRHPCALPTLINAIHASVGSCESDFTKC